MTISKNSIDEVRARADIVTEIGARLELKKSGSNYTGLCPFHAEKSPSFSVSLTKQFFHCFGCGKSGDVIQFLMDHDGMQFHEAVHDLGERLGVKVEEDQNDASVKSAQAQRKKQSSLEDECEQAARFYQKQLPHWPPALAYTEQRGLSAEVMATYGIGYAPEGWRNLASVFPDYNAAQLVECGLVIASDPDQPPAEAKRYDRFRNRLMFPIRNVRGRCIGFGGRVLGEDKPKYLNSPETAIFLKHQTLYGLHEARAHISTEKFAFVTEGYMDVVSLAQFGIGNAVATLGTALSEDHLRLLLRFTDRICFVFDGDGPGKKAAEKALRVALPLLEPRHSLSFLTLPDSNDPDDYLHAHGKAQFLQLAHASPTLSQYLMKTLMEQFGTQGQLPSAEAKTQFSTVARQLCNQIPARNPLKALLMEEINTAIGYAPRMPMADRLRRITAQQPAPHDGAPKPQWLPREEWLQAQKANGLFRPAGRSALFMPALPAVAPALDTRSLWGRIYQAAMIAPQQADAIAQTLTSILDTESSEELRLSTLLEQCKVIPFHPERHPPDTLQAAIDLLQNAHKLIIKHRAHEVSEELKRMRAQGEISEAEFIHQSLALMG